MDKTHTTFEISVEKLESRRLIDQYSLFSHYCRKKKYFGFFAEISEMFCRYPRLFYPKYGAQKKQQQQQFHT